jgi:succinate dehydrogenase hydrophobic anchor subunit
MKILKQMVNNRENREGVKGSYWFQRLTGIFLLMYVIGRVYETSSLVRGENNNPSHLTIVKGLGYGLR